MKFPLLATSIFGVNQINEVECQSRREREEN